MSKLSLEQRENIYAMQIMELSKPKERSDAEEEVFNMYPAIYTGSEISSMGNEPHFAGIIDSAEKNFGLDDHQNDLVLIWRDGPFKNPNHYAYLLEKQQDEIRKENPNIFATVIAPANSLINSRNRK